MFDEVRLKRRRKGDIDAANMIYDVEKARRAYRRKKLSARRISVMKQMNIQEAAKDDSQFTLKELQGVMYNKCGYCFETESRKVGSSLGCSECRMFKINSTACIKSRSFECAVRFASSKKEFRRRHLEWCRTLGLLRRKV